jgi:hypothetical protein
VPLTLSAAKVARVLKYEQLIPAMEKPLLAFSAGRVIQPVRNMLTMAEGKCFVGIMPAVSNMGRDGRQALSVSRRMPARRCQLT